MHAICLYFNSDCAEVCRKVPVAMQTRHQEWIDAKQSMDIITPDYDMKSVH